MRSLSVLVIEHDVGLGETVSTILVSQGHQVRVVRSSAEAQAIIRQSQPDLVVSNTWLETRDAGWQLLQQLWESASTRHLPVLVYSTNIPRLRERSDQLHGQRRVALQAPFDLQDFLAAIEQVMRKPPA